MQITYRGDEPDAVKDNISSLISSSNTKIEDFTFKGIQQITALAWDISEISMIGVAAFSLTGATTVPEFPRSLTDVDDNAFEGCEALESLSSFEKTKVRRIGDCSFAETKLEEVVVFRRR
ncbi:hypothetical protein TrST_g5386 [Triparma strigata]|uniref:Leucine-rich repeat domain-containing protein n=1 Tax=Triparma strigata TaxID=1606541 RepID=A0A9W7F085_9STRA|nr:hypothetical protein TrST_g5386 [Triparma strigata]